MVDLSHIQKQFEELEASMTPEERAERGRKHQETLSKLAQQQERNLAPYRQMERLLAPYRAIEDALAQVELTREFRRLAEPSLFEVALAGLTRADEIESSQAQMAGPSSMVGATAELLRIRDIESSLVQALGQSAAETTLSELARITAIESTLGLGLKTHELLAEPLGRTMFAELEAMRLQEQLLQDALNPRSLIDESFRRLADPLPLDESMMATGLGSLADGYRDLLSSDPLPYLDPNAGVAFVDDDEPTTESELETADTSSPGRLPLKARRVAAYYVFLDDIRREPEDSIIIDYLVERLCALRDAMIREIEDGLY
jgi:hypothetical protein